MLGGSKRHGTGVLVLLAVLALAAGACSSSTGTATPSETANPTDASTDTSGPTASADNIGSDVYGAAANIANLTSYKFKVTLAGGSFSPLLAMFGDPGSDNAAFTITGTVVTSPDPGTDVKIASHHVIEIGGFDYLDMGDGSYTKAAVSGSGLVSGVLPQALYASAINASAADGYSLVGTEDKNGVPADHYRASAAYLAEYGSILGVANATWSADAWIAKTGGYPVSVSILAKAADGSMTYELSFDLTNVGDAANSVTAPTNVAGA